jgi:hypothetical protein
MAKSIKARQACRHGRVGAGRGHAPANKRIGKAAKKRANKCVTEVEASQPALSRAARSCRLRR